MFVAAALALHSLSPAGASAHPATGIVVDARGLVHFSDLETVWRLEPGGALKVLATVGEKEKVTLQSSSKPDAHVREGVEASGESTAYRGRLERALGIYFGLGVVAIGAVAGLKGYARRRGHA